MSLHHSLGFVLLALLSTTACGGNAPPESCPATPAAACGGNLVGTWHTAKLCSYVTLTFPYEGCRGLVQDLSGMTYTGTLVFRADGTYREDLVSEGTWSTVVPAACVKNVGTCSQLEAALNFGFASQGATVKCPEAAEGACRCVVTMPRTTNADEGSYTTSGTTVTTTSSTRPGTTVVQAYCVDGSVLSSTVVISPGMGAAAQGAMTRYLTK